jgi:hypothetical protein
MAVGSARGDPETMLDATHRTLDPVRRTPDPIRRTLDATRRTLDAARSTPVLIGLAVAGALASPAPTHAQIPPGYEVIRLTDDPDLDGPPAINNLGHVVWSKRIDQGFDTEEIFMWDGAAVRRITNDNVRDAFPDINDNGTIVWSRAKRPGEPDNLDIVRWQNGELTHVTDDEVRDSAATINNLDHVAWYQTIGAGCSGFANVFVYDGETIQQITDSGRGLLDQGVQINDFDELAWTRYDFCQNPWMGTIMLYSGGMMREVSDGMGQDQVATINNQREVAWGWGPPDRDGIAIWHDGVTKDVTAWGDHPAINLRSDLVFQRWHEDIRATKQWIHKCGGFLRITADALPEWVASINDCPEAAWNRGPFPNTDVFVMRTIPGDTDHDGTVDLSDLKGFHRCLTGPRSLELSCGGRSSDVDADGDVDLRDYAIFGARTDNHVDYETLLGCMTGPRRLLGRCDCLASDFDRDGDVDLRDFAGLQSRIGGAP